MRVNSTSDLAFLDHLTAAQRESLGLVEGHVSWDVVDRIGRPARVVTMLRDPIERVLSFYSYVRAKSDHHLHQYHNGDIPPLHEFLTLESSGEIDNWMVRQLAGGDALETRVGGLTRTMLDRAAGRLDSCAAVGVTDRFDESLALFAETLGWKRWERPRLNVTIDRVRREELDDTTLELLRERTTLDRELYEHAVHRLDRVLC